MISGIGNGVGITSGVQQMTKPDPEEMFKKMDANGDGKISKDELTSALSEMSSKSGKSMNVEDIFTRDDTDGDGTISEEEYLAAVKKMEQMQQAGWMNAAGAPPPPPDSAELFKEIDTDGDGGITKDELKAHMSKMASQGGDRPRMSISFSVKSTRMETA